MVGWWDDDTPVTAADPDRADVRACAEERNTVVAGRAC